MTAFRRCSVSILRRGIRRCQHGVRCLCRSSTPARLAPHLPRIVCRVVRVSPVDFVARACNSDAGRDLYARLRGAVNYVILIPALLYFISWVCQILRTTKRRSHGLEVGLPTP